jgi:hypothetical protein
MYSDSAAVAAVPAGAAGVALFAPSQIVFGVALLAVLALVLIVLMGVRANRTAQH